MTTGRVTASRRLLALAGVLCLGWGARGLVTSVSVPQLVHVARFLLASVAAHDLVLAPVSALVAVLTTRLLPPAVRTPARVGLALALLVTVLALPVITSEHRLRNPSVLPLDYERNLLVLLAAIGAGTALSAVVALATARRRRQGSPPPG